MDCNFAKDSVYKTNQDFMVQPGGFCWDILRSAEGDKSSFDYNALMHTLKVCCSALIRKKIPTDPERNISPENLNNLN